MPARKTDPKRYCRFCKARLRRKVFSSGRLEELGQFVRRIYCDRICMAQGMVKEEVSKSAHHWRARKNKRPNCDRCGSTDNLHVHHKDEDWKNDDPDNHETVCEACHSKEHAPKRGDLFASREWVAKDLLTEMWASLREAYELASISDDPSITCIVPRLEDLLHRGGQL